MLSAFGSAFVLLGLTASLAGAVTGTVALVRGQRTSTMLQFAWMVPLAGLGAFAVMEIALFRRDYASLLEAASRLRAQPTFHTGDTVRGWLLNLPVTPGLLWKDLGIEPLHSTIDSGLPASLDSTIAFRWLHPVWDRKQA